MSKLPFVFAAIAVGGLIALQPGLNADVARRIGNPFVAAFVSVTVAFVVAAIYLLVTRPAVQWSNVATLPWYLWSAGAIGVIFVIGSLWLAPVLGAASLFAAMVAGQMIMATTVDWLGFSGYQSQGFDPMRILAIGLVIAGVLIFHRSA